MPFTQYFQFAFTEYASQKAAEHIVGNIPFTPTSSLWIALGNNSSAALTGEPTGNNYARLEINGGTGRTFGSYSADEFATMTNAQAWRFNRAEGGDWGSIVSANFMDASTGGNQLAFARYSPSPPGFVTILDGETWQYGVNDIEFRNSADPPIENGFLTAYATQKIFDLLLKCDGTAAPNTNVYLGLLLDDNEEATRRNIAAGTYTEVSGSGYARIEVGNDSPASGVTLTYNSSFREYTIDADVTWPTITDPGYGANIFRYGTFDSPTGGNLLMSGWMREGGISGTLTTTGLPGSKNSFFRAESGTVVWSM
jgi:hypothetical protein